MKKKSIKIFSAVVLFTQLGFSMAIPIMLGALLGGYLDKRLNTKAVFLIIFLLAGIFAGFATSYRLIKTITDRKDTEE